MNHEQSSSLGKLISATLCGYSVDLSSLPNSVDDLAAHAAKSFGQKAAFAVVLPSGVNADLSFQQIDEFSSAFASYLINVLGLAVGDVVAIQLPNSLHYPIAVLGAWKAGLIVTNVNPLYTERELRHQLADSGAKLLVACDLFLPRAEGVVSALGVKLVVASLWDFFAPTVAPLIRQKMEAGAGASLTPSMAHLRFADALGQGFAFGKVPKRHHTVALYQYTGGTTGRSKGAIITHQNILATMRMTRDYLDAYDGAFRSDETVLTVLPLYHVFAFTVNFLLFFQAGASNLLIPNPRPLSNLRFAFEEFQIDWMSGVDTLYAGLLSEPWFRERPPKLKFAFSGGTALRPSTAELWQKVVCPVLEGYGLTETSCIVSCNPPIKTPRVGTVGFPLPGCDVRIIDAEGRDLGPMQAGELIVRGPQVVQGYLNQPQDSTTTIVDGWLHTGDIALIETDGCVRIVDRKKDMILVSGFNVYPNEVEAVIAEHPDVVEVAVIGVRDDATGEAVRAFVSSSRSTLTAEEVIQHCKSNLTAYKVPKQIVFRDQLPKSAVGKILRAQLRESA